MQSEERLTWTMAQTARLLGISRSSAYSLAVQNVIPTIRLGRRLVVPKVALERMLGEAGKQQDN